MKLSLLVLSSPYGSPGANSAYRYAEAAVASGHSLQRIFFFDEGALSGSAYSVPPQGQVNYPQRWAQLQQASGCELVLCIASALKRGMVDSTEAERYELPASTIHPAFSLGGLGLLVDATVQSDRLITFGPA